MAVESGFFNSVNRDRLYNARQVSRYFENILSSGIFKRITNCLKVTAATGMSVNVAIGAGLIDSQWFRVTAAENVPMATAHAVLPRIDNIVARLDLTDEVRAITLMAVSGTPAENPAAPAPIITTSVQDLVLAQILVEAGDTQIKAENITDTRANEALCGFVHSLVDTPVHKSYNSRYVAIANDTTVAPINIAAYNANADLLNVYINGFRLAPGVEYTINPATNSITLAEPIDVGTVIDFEAHVPMMPEEGVPDLAEVVADLAQAVTNLQADVEALETDTGWMQLSGANGINFSANWVPKLRKVGKVVYLRGLCTGVTANQTQLLTIPAGYRPPVGGHAYVGYCGNADDVRAARLFVEETGEVIFRSAGAVLPAANDPILITTSWLID